MSNSFQMAVDHINTKIENVTVSLRICEDLSDSSYVLSNVPYMMEDFAPDFLLGPYSSTLTNVLANYTTRSNILLATSAAASTSVFENRTLIFGILPPSKEYPTSSLNAWAGAVSIEGQSAANYTVGFFAEDTTFTNSMCSEIESKAQALGFSISASNLRNGNTHTQTLTHIPTHTHTHVNTQVHYSCHPHQ